MTTPITFHQSNDGVFCTIDAQTGAFTQQALDWLTGTVETLKTCTLEDLFATPFAVQQNESGQTELFATAIIGDGEAIVEGYALDSNKDKQIDFNGQDKILIYTTGMVGGKEVHHHLMWDAAQQKFEESSAPTTPDYSMPQDVLRPENWRSF